MGNQLTSPSHDPFASAVLHHSTAVSNVATPFKSSHRHSNISMASNKNEGTKQQGKVRIDDPEAIKFFQELGVSSSFFEDGRCQAWKLQPTDPDFHRIYKYVENSQELAFGVKILNLLRIKPCAHEAVVDFKDDPQVIGKHRKMLFHGTRAENLEGIMQRGLRLPQNDTAGLYFADRVAKGCFYTDEGHSKDLDGKQGYVLLSDVLLGRMNSGHVTHNSRAAPPIRAFDFLGMKVLVPCQSVMVRAVRVPDPKGNVMVDGCEWPLGPTINNWDFFYQFNEFIVYDAKQVQPKFVMKVEFTEEPYYHELND